MRLLLNVIWVVLSGFWAFLGWAAAAIIMTVLIITIPFAVQAAKIAVFSLWPFGRTVVKREDASAGLSTLGNVLWVVLCGWWLALLHLVAGVVLCLTVIGIPLGLGNFKLILISLWPFGREIVSVEEARARGASDAVSIGTEARDLSAQ